MIYLLVVYRFLGLVADIALLIYAALFYGLIVLVPITMTLPGIAGIILTIGVAADANVVIFERIKEEVRLGRTVRQAISQGYSKGFHTILDANVCTLITAAVLYIAGTGSVKGFAFTLAVGVIVSMFTAILATRAMLSLLGGFRWFHNAAFMGASGAKVRWRIDVMGRKKMWFAISAHRRADLGRLARRARPEPGHRLQGRHADHDDAREAPDPGHRQVARHGHQQGLLRRDRAGPRHLGRTATYKQFQIEDKTLTPAEVESIRVAAPEQVRDREQQLRLRVVSASFGSEILKSAIYAVIFSLLLIVAYVSARFEWKYAVPMIVALIHDVVITIGVYSITGREVTSSTVAAVLTVLGYSLYDTIIVFDRVRENTPLLRKNSFSQIVNVSIWETLTRSINTTLITVVPILTLLLFGGSTLKDFAFALAIGIMSGAYSSLFVASPLLAVLEGARARVPQAARDGRGDHEEHAVRRERRVGRPGRSRVGAGHRRSAAALRQTVGGGGGAKARPVRPTKSARPARPRDAGASSAAGRAARTAVRADRACDRHAARPRAPGASPGARGRFQRGCAAIASRICVSSTTSSDGSIGGSSVSPARTAGEDDLGRLHDQEEDGCGRG